MVFLINGEYLGRVEICDVCLFAICFFQMIAYCISLARGKYSANLGICSLFVLENGSQADRNSNGLDHIKA